MAKETFEVVEQAEFLESFKQVSDMKRVFTFEVEFGAATFLTRPWDPVTVRKGEKMMVLLEGILEQIGEIDVIASKPLTHKVRVYHSGVLLFEFPVKVDSGSAKLG